MRYIVLTICLIFFAGCESNAFVFEPCTQYGGSYLTAMSQYVCNLQSWDCNTQGMPPQPQRPGETYAGGYPSPTFQGAGLGSSFMQGSADGFALGSQMGAIKLQNARNQAYGIALGKYYRVVNSCKYSKASY